MDCPGRGSGYGWMRVSRGVRLTQRVIAAGLTGAGLTGAVLIGTGRDHITAGHAATVGARACRAPTTRGTHNHTTAAATGNVCVAAGPIIRVRSEL